MPLIYAKLYMYQVKLTLLGVVDRFSITA